MVQQELHQRYRCSAAPCTASARRRRASLLRPQRVCLPHPRLSPHLHHSTEPRRAAVALIIRVVPSPSASLPSNPDKPPTLTQFFEAEWVNDPAARPELLYLHRENTAGTDESLWQTKLRKTTNEEHVAFPGGRQEADDEGGLYTGAQPCSTLCPLLGADVHSSFYNAAMRQTWEELGIDLAEPCYTCIGQLDDREITTSLGKRLLMILSPFVFLQLTPSAPLPDPVATTSLHWTPLSSLVSLQHPPTWSTVTVDAASRLAPKHSAVLKFLVQVLIGSMQFPAIVLNPSDSYAPAVPLSEKSAGKRASRPQQKLKLWGLSLGMTLDLLAYMILPMEKTRGADDSLTPTSPLSEVMQLPYQHVAEDFRMEYVAPSLASVFPRFSYPDVNFWIWYVCFAGSVA